MNDSNRNLEKFSSGNKYLVFSSIGVKSVHNQWLDTTNRSYDVVLVYYDDDDTYYEELVKKQSYDLTIIRRKGFKWPNFYWFITNYDVSEYRYIWVPDDDIELKGDKINEMFAIMEEHPNIMIASPSTTSDSVNAEKGRRRDFHKCNVEISYTNFIECCFILLNGKMLNDSFFIKILSLTNTGYWFDILIKFCFNEIERQTTHAILHDIIARHPKRSIGTSEMTKIIPRNKHPSDMHKFVRSGIPREMFKYGYIIYSEVKNDYCKNHQIPDVITT